MSTNPYAFRPERLPGPVGTAQPVGSAPPPVPAAPGYAENQPGQPRTLPAPAHPYAPVAPPSPTSVQVLGYATAALLAGQVLLMVSLAAASTWSVVSYAGTAGGPGQPLPAAQVTALLTGLLYLSVPLCGIAFVAWLFVATRNARSWGSPVRRGPGWAIGSWFVPFLAWWRPKQMVDDVWRASSPAAPPGAPLHLIGRSGLTLAWWTTWLLAPVVVQVGTVRAVLPLVDQFVQALRYGTVPPVVDVPAMQETIAIWSLWAYVLWSVCAFTATVVVVQVTQWQRRRLTELTAAR